MTMRITGEVKTRLQTIQEENNLESLNEAVDYLIKKNSPTGEKFYEWLSEIVHPAVLSKYVLFSDSGDRTCVKIYTASHVYNIVYRHDGGYLGCTASTTSHRPGENWTRGNDLPDGKFNRKTWESIKNAIIRYELQELSDYIRNNQSEDVVVWDEDEEA